MPNLFTIASLTSMLAAVLGVSGCGKTPVNVKGNRIASSHRASERRQTMNATGLPQPWVIRSDISSDENWDKIRDLIAAPQRHAGIADEFYVYVKYINDPKYGDKSPQEVFRSLPDDYLHGFCFIVDAECIQNAEHPVLVVAYRPTEAEYESFTLRKPSKAPLERIAMFRALPSQIQSILNNLSIGNLDFEDFANRVDPDGVYRGVKH